MPTRRHLVFASLALATPAAASNLSRAEIRRDVNDALARLRRMENARPLLDRAVATLIFPRILAGGFIAGGQYGEGALLREQRIASYHSIAGASFGLLAGAQVSGLAMFFMRESALASLMRADGWEIGTGPSVVMLDRGLQANATSTTLTEPVYAISFNHQGLMAALAINGTKISRIRPG